MESEASRNLERELLASCVCFDVERVTRTTSWLACGDIVMVGY